jgi:hypothetical protein
MIVRPPGAPGPGARQTRILACLASPLPPVPPPAWVAAAQRRAGLAAAGPVRRSPAGWLARPARRAPVPRAAGGRGRRGIYLGAKGIGEAGTIGAVPAVQNAVIDALSPLGARHIDMPATPARVWAAISEARESR